MWERELDLGGVLLTGLFAGGASCAAVQGGLLAGVVASRRPDEAPIRPRNKSKAARRRAELLEATRRPDWLLDTIPVAGFLGGKLVSHALMGAVLGLLGSALEFGYRPRAATQVLAGLVMFILAAHLFGVRAIRHVIPHAPTAVTRFIRRNSKSQLAAAPALLGLATIFIPCGITISVEVLAAALGSAFAGAIIMATFVLGTSPLFALLGYLFRRSATALRGKLSSLAAVAVVLAGIFSINAGLVLAGSSVNLNVAWSALAGPGGGPAVAAAIDKSGTQQIVVNAFDTSYSPSSVTAKANVPTHLTVRTNGDHGCTRGIVFQSLGVERSLPETGDTLIDLGTPRPGAINYTCSMGMYRGSIDVI